MGRTTPSFRFASVLEEKEWESYKRYLTKKDDKKAFNDMFSIVKIIQFCLFLCDKSSNKNTSYYDVNTLSSLQNLKEKYFGKYHFYNFNYIYNDYNTSNNNNNILLKRELDNGITFLIF